MAPGAMFTALLLAADGGAAAARDAGPPPGPAGCELVKLRRDGQIDRPAIEAALARGCAIDAIRVWRSGTVFWWSLANGEYELTRWLLAHGANPAARDEATGKTALHAIAEADSADAVAALDLFVRRGLDVNAVTHGNATPLHVAGSMRGCVLTPRCACMQVVSRLPPCRIESNPRMIRALLAHGADPNRADVHGVTPLFLAAQDNLLEEVATLLKAGARPRGRDGNQDTIWALMKHPDPRIVRLLLAHGADPNERDGTGMIALHWLAAVWSSEPDGLPARRRQFLTVAKLLMARGADVRAATDRGETPLHDAASTGFTELARLLVAAGTPVDAVDKRGQTPLHVATNQGHADVVAFLLDHGAAASARDAAGLTPLHALAHANSLGKEPEVWRRIVRLLVRHGGRFDAQDDAGRTPLFHAAGNPAVARLLVASGGAKATVGPLGASPLHVAVFRDDESLVRTLIGLGFKVDARDRDGRTPLHWAAFLGRSRALDALITAPGIDLEAVDRAGSTALGWAVESCQTNAAALLRAKGARPPPANATGTVCSGSTEPPLHAAARKTNLQAARALVAAGADVNARDGQGRTALHVAPAYALGVPLDTYKLLLDKGADVSRRDAMGRTPLHAAYDRSEGGPVMRFAELLVCRGADPNPRDLFGWTPIDLAVLRGWRAPAVPPCGSGSSSGTPAPR